MRPLRILVLFLLTAVPMAFAGKEFTKPRAADAGTYPAHEEHREERVTVAIDPYDSVPKSEIFKINWKGYGYLPVYFIITNYGDQPIALTKMKIQWVTANRSKLEPASTADLVRRLSQVRGSDPRVPLPLPGRGMKPSVSKEARNEIEAAQFQAMSVAPHTTQAGFLFFDVGDIREPLAGAHFFADGIKNADAKELFYFDVPVDKYLGTSAAN